MPAQTTAMIRHLLTYAAICLIANILVLSVYAIYLVVWVIMGVGNEDAGWVMPMLGCGVLLATGVMNVFALYYVFDYNAMTRKRLQFIVLFTAMLAGGYSLLAIFSSVAALAWTYLILVILLLPVPIIFSRPTALSAIQALPVEPKDIDYFA